ncbi:MAG: DUF1800 domain-containing protein [Steroidobacteraceae bacterium]
MSATTRLLGRSLAAVAAVLSIAGCGGGGGGGGGVGTPPTPAITRGEAHRFLVQASFGPDAPSVQRVIDLGYEGWIDEQLRTPATRHLDYMRGLPQPNSQLDRQDAWFQAAIQGRDQLRQRMAFALSEIWVVSENSGLNQFPQALAWYQDLLAENAFGNYRTLMERVTLSPEMGYYLSMLGNEKPDRARNIRPDENYARELMQLFTIGLVQLEPDGTVRVDGAGVPLPTYDQRAIEAFAHVFTGWTFGGSPAFHQPSFDWLQPMQPFEAFHDTGAKTLLNGATVAAGGTARTDLAAALDNIFAHPNVAPFVSRQLIQRFVTSNPSPAYVERVARVFGDNGRGVRGDLGAVVKAILLDAEARATPSADHHGKLKEPLLRLTGLWRAYGARAANGRYAVQGLGFLLGQAPLQSPSVFNFFRPDHAPPGEIADAGRVAPEMQIANELTSAMTTNLFTIAVFAWNRFDANLATDAVAIDFSGDATAAADPAALVTRISDRLLGGSISTELRREAEALAARYPTGQENLRVLEVAHLIATSAEFAVQR